MWRSSSFSSCRRRAPLAIGRARSPCPHTLHAGSREWVVVGSTWRPPQRRLIGWPTARLSVASLMLRVPVRQCAVDEYGSPDSLSVCIFFCPFLQFVSCPG